MPIHTMKFFLPRDRDELTLAMHGGDFWGVLWDVNQEMRRRMKYTELSEAEYKQVEELREHMFGSMENHNVHLDMVS